MLDSCKALKCIQISSLLIFALSSCAHSPDSVELGMQLEHKGFVPARIAILKCRPWTGRTPVKGLPLSNAPKKNLDEICSAFDKKVLDAFSGQPYMRGYSPAGVEKVLQRNGKGDLDSKWAQTWSHESGECNDCTNGAEFYVKSISEREAWRQWLQIFSAQMNNVDAVLVPFVVFGREHIFDDRGLWVAERDANVTTLLISTITGELLWAGARTAGARNQRMHEGQVSEAIAYPPWEDVMNRLFIADLWREFPGRQEF